MQSSLVSATVLFAVSLGISMKQIHTATGLSTADLLDTNARLPDHLVALVWKLIDAARPGEALPLKMAAIAPAAYFGVLVHAWRHSQEPEDALNLFIRFHRTLADRLHVEVSQTKSATSVHFSHPSDSIDGGCGAEVGAATAASFARNHFDDNLPLGVRFENGPHGPIKAYEDFFGVPIEFNTGRTELIFRTDFLSQPVKGVDRDLSNFLIGQLEEVSAALGKEKESGFLLRVRQAVATNARHADYSIQGLATRLGLSVRSIQRKAKKENIHLAGLVYEARMAHAKKMLSSQDLTVGEVSFLLGYSEVRSFARAFKRHSGKTPSEFMKAPR